MQNVHANLIKQISNNYFKFFMYSYNKLIVSNILIIKKKKKTKYPSCNDLKYK